MQADIAIVIAAYNRPASLQRLLSSIAKADYSSYSAIELLISIDHSGREDCKAVADAFEWKHGNKTVIQHQQNLGLKKHILFCGDHSQLHEAVIVLEDDLFVSPVFYSYAQQAHAFYKTDQHIAGVALYHNTFNEVGYCPFEPLHDGYDNYFMQVPCSWGQLWNKEQWTGFIDYTKRVSDEEFTLLPATVQAWPTATSWKKLFYSYLHNSGKYFVYPRVGLSTNFGDAGQHLRSEQTAFQTPLLLSKKTFQFSTIETSLSIYDGFFEPAGIVYNILIDADKQISFDLNGTKPLSSIKTRFLISSKVCRKPLQQFAVTCYPYENNIFLNIVTDSPGGAYFSLAETKDFSEQQQFSRLPIDLKRIFLTDEFLRQSVQKETQQAKEFRLGSSILKPVRLITNFFKKSNSL